MPFVKGQSGNPHGRPKGVGKVARLRTQIERHVPAIIDELVEAAKNGEIKAARLLVERVIPPLRSVDLPVSLPLPEDLGDAARTILGAVSEAKLTPDQGARLLAGLGSAVRAIELSELEERIATLEQSSHEPTN